MDRISIRSRPQGKPIMHQRWCKLLFLHWKMDPSLLRPMIPSGLEIDTFDGSAWIGLTPLTISDIRPTFLPAVPLLSGSHELNLRTYVHRDGVPGVWFFSLDANNPLAVPAARLAFHLPYFRARIQLEEVEGEIRFASRRSDGFEPVPAFEARWERLGSLTPPAPSSLEFFLIERYCLYSVDDRTLYRTRIHHRPWPLRAAVLRSLNSTMLTGQGLPRLDGEPIVHAQGDALDVEIWKPEAIGPK